MYRHALYLEILNKSFLLQIFWAIGACFEVLLALVVMPTLGWQWLLALSALPLLLFSICCFVSESKILIVILLNLLYFDWTFCFPQKLIGHIKSCVF
jgi:hypothetical protein